MKKEDFVKIVVSSVYAGKVMELLREQKLAYDWIYLAKGKNAGKVKIIVVCLRPGAKHYAELVQSVYES